MKKRLVYFFLVSIIASITGCKKDNNDGNAVPDVSDFSIMAQSPYTVGGKGILSVTSATLAPGVYTVKYNCSGANRITDQTAILTMNNHTGTFQTPVLDTGWATYITIDSIINTKGKVVGLASNNFATLSDSTGLMTATLVKSGSTPFNAITLIVDTLGARLGIAGYIYAPTGMDKKLIYIFTTNYTNAIGTYTFTNTFFGGGGLYETQATGAAPVDNDAVYGQINLTAITPLLIGTFSMTCQDSTKISGSFSTPAL